MGIKEKIKSIFDGCGLWICVGRITHGIITVTAGITGVVWLIASAVMALIVGLVMLLAFFWDNTFLRLNFMLYAFSFFAKLGLYPIGLIYKLLITILFYDRKTEVLSKYFRDIAIANDQTGNVYLEELLNNAFIEEYGYKFGNPDETISGVLGKNYYNKSLRIAGKIFAFILEVLDKGHLKNAIENDENWGD